MIYWVNITEPGNFVYPGIILEQKTIKITDFFIDSLLYYFDILSKTYKVRL